jgi:hypothetical protein
MTKRECDLIFKNIEETLMQTPDDVRDEHPDCKWSEVNTIKINEALVRAQDARAALRDKITVPEYLEKYERRYIYDQSEGLRKREVVE